MSDARYAVGIDLGTTNSALSFLPLEGDATSPEVLAIPQLVHPGEVQARALLPSYLYLPHGAEFPPGALALPWDPAASDTVGELARAQGALTPVRLVSSAKSWLSHPALDRRAASLPAGSPAEVPKVSPLEASSRYLAHLRAAWDAQIARGDAAVALERQRVTLTVPASFDAVARELTVEAARAAGLPEITLLEEPQAALYAWVEAMGDRWRKEVKPGDLILVIDVGGGTTDLSLIAVVDREGDLGLERVAVGDHILLGGDNMDLALAYALERKLSAAGRSLDRWQIQALTHGARQAKEALFANRAVPGQPVTVPGRGSGLIGGAIRTELTRDELLGTLVDGFFPMVESSARPAAQRRAALTTLGLPYASDPGVMRHLAAFLSRQREGIGASSIPGVELAGRAFLHPTAVLFNGGVMKATELRSRVMDVLSSWVAAEGGAAPRELPGVDLDLAVAKGAASYGRVRAGHGIRIRGGTARAYYVGIETAMPAVPGMPPPVQALCVAPMGMEEGTAAELDSELGLVVGEPTHFRFFASSLRREDRVGTVVEREAELEELPPIETTLPAEGDEVGRVVPVKLRADVTEIGTLELTAVDEGGRAWKVEFNLRQDGGAAAGEGAETAP
ncbi:MAG TPA: Hsp70 family protein [Anaeromyxobacteraceae bacterium]|nr:Hsp70 family protein [Anaeromyxobacteraceae bacterium]